ncbi:uncharacterized protein EV422DRAFT_301846 [Fimicolochytrium jonesii]|uniref:uncharacterized protein n=1 Tax=Fimicolochytrium jonesii TaxID=1396493 RepID=UPI0022FEF0E3|nr:uncharacterized protein EV422DRAFT_301846 [Fimicolochytrium jonesii]KAI8823974.1 hypothetical protein EV422DRAFT_301846 [Fimicolochytrium jonesii]
MTVAAPPTPANKPLTAAVAASVDRLRKMQAAEPEEAMTIIVIQALLEDMKQSSASSTSEFIQQAQKASKALEKLPYNQPSMIAGTAIFKHILEAQRQDDKGFDDWKRSIFRVYDQQIARYKTFRERAACYGLPFVKDDAVILLHSFSRTVMVLLQKAKLANRRFKVFVTETRGTTNGSSVVEELSKHNIPVELILDAAVGSIINRVDMVIVGAEGVTQTGGLINRIGTYQIAIVAQAANKPFYVVAEQYKFVKLCPLSQTDLPIPSSEFYKLTSKDSFTDRTPHTGHPAIDYTPPQYIHLFFTNVGVLTPAGASEELMKFYMP